MLSKCEEHRILAPERQVIFTIAGVNSRVRSGDQVSICNGTVLRVHCQLHHCVKLFLLDDKHAYSYQILLRHGARILGDEAHVQNLAYVDGCGRQPMGESMRRERHLVCASSNIIRLTSVSEET